MTLEQVKKLRAELHHLAQASRDKTDKEGNLTINIPLIIQVNTSFHVDEMESCVIWDDDNELLYSMEYNNSTTAPLSKICPMQVKAYPYSEINFIGCRLDKNTTLQFLNSKLAEGLTSKSVIEKYTEYLEDINNARWYSMGDQSETTEKRSLKPDDKMINPNSYETI